jgi:hypothetical protein
MKGRTPNPNEFDDESEDVLDYRVVVDLAAAVYLDLSNGFSQDEVIDSLYKSGFSPEAVDIILQTNELSEGNYN